MSRYSPQVLPIAGATFADSLLQGVDTYLQTRRRRADESRAQSAEQRAANADTRAGADLTLRQEENTRAQNNQSYRESLRPVERATIEADARAKGVFNRNSGRPVPEAGEDIPSSTDYYIDPNQTPDAIAAARAQALEDKAAADRKLRREEIEAATERARIGANSRVETQRIRSANRPGTGGGQPSAATLREAGSQARRALTSRDNIQRMLNDDPGNPDLQSALQDADDDVSYYESQRQEILRSMTPAGVTLPSRGGGAAPASPFMQSLTPGAGGFPGMQPSSPSPAPGVLPPQRGGAIPGFVPPGGTRTPAPAPVGGADPRRAQIEADENAKAQRAIQAGANPDAVMRRMQANVAARLGQKQ